MFKTIGVGAALIAVSVASACGGTGSTGGATPSPTLSASATPSAPASPPPNTGTIAGHVNTPAEVVVAQLVYAISTTSPAKAFATETIFNQTSYSIRGVAPGTYNVYTTRRPVEVEGDGKVHGALYSQAVACGLDVSCTDHSALTVTVSANATISGIDVIDWYVEGTLPAPPDAVVPVSSPSPAPTGSNTYASARDAGAAIGNGAAGIVVDAPEACPYNRACTWLGAEHDGTNAAYFDGGGGSNGSWLACGTYVYRNSAGWHGLRGRPCADKLFPAVGGTGTVWIGLGSTSCVYARNAPGPTGVKVTCVKHGTQVKISGGPAYAPLAGTNGLWWDVESRGWMADTYLQ